MAIPRGVVFNRQAHAFSEFSIYKPYRKLYVLTALSEVCRKKQNVHICFKSIDLQVYIIASEIVHINRNQ